MSTVSPTLVGQGARRVPVASIGKPYTASKMNMLNIRTLSYPAIVALSLATAGCSSTYYATMEKVGIPKRDIMVDRVEEARDSQQDAQDQFQSALDQFGSVVALEETDLKAAYDKLNKEYERCESAARDVSDRIDSIESVSEALFDEWEDELDEYDNKELRDASSKQLKATRSQYDTMLKSMHEAEASMDPVLAVFHDNVLFLKHNLNAQAIGSLKGEFDSLKVDINGLIDKMNASIAESNAFIANMTGS